MALREKLFRCGKCGNQWTIMHRVGDPLAEECCGIPALELIGAPAVKFRKPYFNRGLGVFIKDAGHEEQVLRERGAYRPSKQDMFRAMDNDPMEAQRPKYNPKSVEAIAEKTFSRLYTENQVGPSGEDLPGRKPQRE